MAKATQTYEKRILILVLILVFSLISIGVPLLSTFGVLPKVDKYIEVGEGVNQEEITGLFADGFSFDIITDNWPLLILAIYAIIALITTLKGGASFVTKGKRKFGKSSFLTILLAVLYLIAGHDFNFASIGEMISGNPMDLIGDNYGVFAMAGAPLVNFVLSAFAYKKE